MAKFDSIVAEIRRDLSFPFEGLQVPPPCWEDEAYLYDADKQIVVFAGVDEEVLRNFPYQQVALRDFVVAGQDADYPLNKNESHIFAKSVRVANDAFEHRYDGCEWHSQVARLIVEMKLTSQKDYSEAIRRDFLSPLQDVLEATLILPPLPESIDFDTADPFDREIFLFVGAELQIPQPLQEQEAVRRIRKCLPQCPANLIGTNVRFSVASPRPHSIRFRVRQF